MTTENEFLQQVKDLAQMYCFIFYHPLISDGSTAGWPDLVLMNVSERRMFFVELKSERGTLTPAQAAWLEGLRVCGQEVYVWRPSQLQEIAEILGKGKQQE